MKNELWQMMINNLALQIKGQDDINIFRMKLLLQANLRKTLYRYLTK